MKKKYILLLLLFLNLAAKAQFVPLSETTEISILTIGPGAELYDKFGHSAFRIQDSINGMDVVFNYGVYDFDTPNFYTKFAQGKLLYQLGVSYYQPFYESYVAQNRWVKEQTLHISHSQKQAISDFLWNNAKPENKKYKYDFFYDNCATKIRDVLQAVLGDTLEFTETHIKETYTFRQLIQQNLQANSWGSMGIDIALGAVIDKNASPIEYQFLPDYVYKGAMHAILKNEDGSTPLVKETKVLFENSPAKPTSCFFLSPLFILTILSILIVALTYRDYKNKTRNRYLDFCIFLFTGIIGLILLLLWFATDHTATANNYNLLWAFPISILFAFIVIRKKTKYAWKRYVLLLILLLALLGIHWVTGVQQFAIVLLPLIIALALRYIYLLYALGKKG